MKVKKSEKQLRKVIQKYVSGKASAEEIRFLEMFYEEFEDRENILDQLDKEEVHRMEAAIQAGVAEQIGKKGSMKGRVVALHGKRWMVAASVLVLLTFGFWLFKPGSKPVEEVKNAPTMQRVPDIQPGGNKAILTLADGSTIILDSAGNGNISQQGNVSVIKLDDGQITYSAGMKSAEVVYNTVTTPRGGQYQIVLADGSKVWLNAASSITFPTSFPGHLRDINITGEAYFEVAHDESKPFYVTVGDMKVEVLGTHFNINAYADEGLIKTTLLEGRVKVVAGKNIANLQPGEQAQFAFANGHLQTLSQADVEEVIAWKNGSFYFRNTSFSDIFNQLSRWYDLNVHFTSQIDGTVSGSIPRDGSIEAVLELLEATGKVQFEIKGKDIIVKSK